MYESSYVLSLGGIILMLKAIFEMVVTRRKRNASARRLGCEPAKRTSRSDPLGIQTMITLFLAWYNHTFPTWYILSLNNLGEKVHTMSARMMLRDLILTRDEKNFKAILSTHTVDWELGELRKGILQSFTGSNVFTYEGSRWKHSRSLIRAAFSRDSVSDLAMYERHIQDLFQHLPSHHDGWTEALDVQNIFLMITADITTEFLYGHSVHDLNPKKRSELATELGVADLPDAQKFTKSMSAIADHLVLAGIFGNYHSYIPSLNFRRNLQSLRQYVEWFVERRLQYLSNDKSMDKQPSGKRFVLLNELSHVINDPVQLRDETIGLMDAGRAGPAALMSWVIFFLAREPRVFDKLRAVILSTFGSTLDPRQIGLAEMRQCKYLQFCIHEALRLGSPAFVTYREAHRDTTLPSGGGVDGASPMFVQKGTMVALSFFAMHHRADLWGADVEEFVPERWESKKIDWSFSPFGGGPRKCIGGKTLHYPAAALFGLGFTDQSFCRTIDYHRGLLYYYTLAPTFR